MTELIFINGKRLNEPPALRAIYFGDGVFESFRWMDSPPVFLSLHLERMRRGAEYLGIPFPGEAEVRLRIEDAVSTATGSDLNVKACLWGEGSTVFHSRPGAASFLVSVKPHVKGPRAISLRVCEERRSPQRRLYSHKTLNYLGNVVAKREALEKGFDEALFLDTDGRVAETSCHNVFWVKGRTLFTPSAACPILPGVTREIVLRQAAQLGYETLCGDYSLDALVSSDYAFLTNAGAGIIYVSSVNGNPMPSATRSFDFVRESLLSEFGWRG